MEKIELAGVVTLYNPLDEDIKNINSYINDIDILYVIDNSEGHDNKNRLPKNKKIKYYFENENKGVGYSLNKGAKLALKDNYKYLLTMDQDTTFNPGVMKKLKEVIQKEDMSKIGIVTPWQETKMKITPVKEEIDYPETIMTSGNILNLDVWKKVGGFKEWLFIDGIDIEYSFNIRMHGYKILRVNSVSINHNLGDIKYKYLFGKEYCLGNHNHLRRYYIMRNNHYIYDMYADFSFYLCRDLITSRDIYKKIILFEKNKLKKIIAMQRGLRDYKKGIKGKYPYKH